MVQAITDPLSRLATLLWDEHNQRWSARARGSNTFVHDADAEQAILMAVEPTQQEKTNGNDSQ